MVCMMYHEQRAPSRRSCCHILLANSHTEIIPLHIPCRQLRHEMIGRLRCMFSTLYLAGCKQRYSMNSHQGIEDCSDGCQRLAWRMVNSHLNVRVQMTL
jgi:hypothetical protein